jgi:hypothetical protein
LRFDDASHRQYIAKDIENEIAIAQCRRRVSAVVSHLPQGSRGTPTIVWPTDRETSSTGKERPREYARSSAALTTSGPRDAPVHPEALPGTIASHDGLREPPRHAVAPIEPHYVARLRIGAVFKDRDYLPTLKPGRGEPRAVDLGLQREEQSNVRTVDAKRAPMQLDVVGQQRP